ncbi:MAG: thioredoxin, partial [Holophaga sp.]|nr:thioredoxin [Holophaga sp.]
HLFVLDADGKVLHSQDTGVLEEGKGYSREKVTAFLTAWKP